MLYARDVYLCSCINNGPLNIQHSHHFNKTEERKKAFEWKLLRVAG